MIHLSHKNIRRNRRAAFAGANLRALDLLDPASVPQKDKKTAVMLQLLRQAALDCRGTQFSPFYSIRTVARHFAVPPTTVSRIYARLKEEGVLGSIWGSTTFIEPTAINRDLRVRGVVGLPASLESFYTARNYRKFFVIMREVLWKHGFATRLLFYETDDPQTANLAELLLNCKVDVVIWFLPNSHIFNTVARLVDRGIRLIRVIDTPPKEAERGYYLNRHRAMKQGLVTWKRGGIDSVTVFCEHAVHSPERLIPIEDCLNEIGISHRVADVDTTTAKDNLSASCRRKNGGAIFASSEAVLELASRYARQFVEFLHQHRAMFVEGAVNLPTRYPLNAGVDLIEFDWQIVARQICNDLVGARSKSIDTPAIFQAEWLH